MKITAVAVASSNMKKTVEFYSILGFEFGDYKETDDHVEPKTSDGSARLMIDTKKLIKEITGEDPKPATHSSFAVEFDSPNGVNEAAKKIKEAGYTLVKEPWDAFWGQRYAVVSDPDGYRVDLFASLN